MYCKNTPRAIKHHLEFGNYSLYLKQKTELANLASQPIVNNITINIQTVQTLNTNLIFKTEAQELVELEKEFENLIK